VVEQTKGQRTEEDLKNAARRLLMSKSYPEIKVTDITAEAGKATGVFYRYFADKDTLLRALAADFEQALHSVVVDDIGEGHGLRTVDDVRRHVEAFWQTYARHRPERRGMFQASVLSPEFQRLHHDFRDREIDIWAAHLLAAGAGLSAERARMSALAVVCLLEYFCYNQSADGDSGVDTLALETVTSLIATGLLGTTGPGGGAGSR
jgi:AcrR family transcriptional regulator